MQLDLAIIRVKALTILVTTPFVLFVVTLPRYKGTAKIWFYSLVLMALAYLVFNSKQLKKISATERLFFAAIVINFLWIAFCYYYNGEPGRGALLLWARHIYFLFWIPLFFLFKKIDISDNVILLSLFFSAALSTTDMLIDLSQGVDLRFGDLNPNAFGPIQACISGMLLFFFIYKTERWQRTIALLGFLLAFTTVILSQSRGTWLTISLLTIFFVLYLARSTPIRKKIIAIIAIVILISSSYFLPMVKSGIDLGVNSVSNYFASNDYKDASRLSSIGSRIELLKTGWYIFLENPITGAGVGSFPVLAKANSERYQVNEVVHLKKQPHNQYIAALATRGIPGLVLLLMVLLIPLKIAMSQKSFNRDTEIARLSIIFICLTYVIGNITENHFEGRTAIMFVGTFLPLLLAKISSDRTNKTSSGSS